MGRSKREEVKATDFQPFPWMNNSCSEELSEAIRKQDITMARAETKARGGAILNSNRKAAPHPTQNPCYQTRSTKTSHEATPPQRSATRSEDPLAPKDARPARKNPRASTGNRPGEAKRTARLGPRRRKVGHRPPPRSGPAALEAAGGTGG